MFKFETSVLNTEGQPIVGATVSIFLTGTSTLAVLYEDDQTTLKTNPLTTDSLGFVQCKAANGKYDYKVGNLPNGATRPPVNGYIFDDPTEAGSASISLSMPGEFNVAGSPGQSLVVTKKTQVANTGYFGPAAGIADTPGFRAMVAEDMPFATSAARGATQYATLADRIARSSSRVLTVADSDWVKVGEFIVGTAVGNIPFDNLLSGTYREYCFEIDDLRFSATAAHGFGFQIGTTSGTTTYITAANYFTHMGAADSAGANGAALSLQANKTTTSALIHASAGLISNGSSSIGFLSSVRFPAYNSGSARQKGGPFVSDYSLAGSADHITVNGGWLYSVATNYDSVRFLPNTGTITAGKITMYGRGK